MTGNNLLIIDDDARLAEMLGEYFAAEGLHLTAVSSGTQGLREAQQTAFDLIILDVMLPGLSGFEVLRQLRDSGSKTPVLMLTARDGVDDRVTGSLGAAPRFDPSSPRLVDHRSESRSGS